MKESQLPLDTPTPESFFADRYKPPSRLTMTEKICHTQELCRWAAVASSQMEHLLAHFVEKFRPQFTDIDRALVDTMAPAMTRRCTLYRLRRPI